MSVKETLKNLFSSGKELTSTNFASLIDNAVDFEESPLTDGGHMLPTNERLHLSTTNKWVYSEGHLSDLIRLQWLADRAKPAIVWVDEKGNDKAAIISHYMANNPESPDHRHLSIETTNFTSGELHTRMEFPFDAEICEIQVHQSNFTVNGTSRIGGEASTNRRLIFTTNQSKAANLDENGTPIYNNVYQGRFAFGISSAAEDGSNGGSNFEIVRYADNGTALDTSLSIDRKTNNVGIGTRTPTQGLDINKDRIRIRTSKTPASSTATGNKGDICWDQDYIYVCIDTNSWRRTALETF